jgi:type II secretory pathway predicted ATPase ExeA
LVLQTLLVGQPELRQTLQRRDLRQFAQRIGIDYHLPALTASESIEYVRHRLKIAGGSLDLFDADAIALAHQHAGGVPRLINQLCDLALVYGFAAQRRSIDAETMAQVVDDRMAGGLFVRSSGDVGRQPVQA